MNTSVAGTISVDALRDEYDVVVVGAGSAGSAFAGTLAAKGGRSILVVDAGPGPASSDVGDLRDQWSLRAMNDRRWSVGDLVDLGGGRMVETRRGRVLGGSSAVNGAYFVRATGRDLERLSAATDGTWSPTEMLESFIRIEHDLDLGATPWHGDSGPVPVSRDDSPEPITEAFLETCATIGFDLLADLNGGVSEGAGLVPFNAEGARRVDAASAFLDPGHAGLSVVADCPVDRVMIRDRRAVGVELVVDGQHRVVHAQRVVLSAGALASATLLMRSGVGPAADLRAAGIDVVHDAPGVGSSTFNHPSLDLMYLPRPGVTGSVPASFMQAALHTDDARWGGEVEVMATRRPYGLVTGSDQNDERVSLRVTLMSTSSRGTIRLATSAPSDPPVVRSHFLDGDGLEDRGRGQGLRDGQALRRAVRQASAMASAPQFASMVEAWSGPTPELLASDHALDDWLHTHLGTAFHLSGSCPVGSPDDPLSVVDSDLQVHGIEGLHVVDASVLPTPLSRGPAATVMMLGELAAHRFTD